MMRFFLLFLWLPISAVAQFNESFTDDDIFNNPRWEGHIDRFIVCDEKMLQLNAPAEKGESWLFTTSEAIEEAVWQTRIRMEFNPSSSNYCRIYLAADAISPDKIKNAVYLELGGTSDDVVLYILDDGQKEKLIDGEDGRLNVSPVDVQVSVSRQGDNWKLELNDGEAWIIEGDSSRPLVLKSVYFGIYCKYTSTRSNKFFFDDIAVTGLPYQDRDAPAVNAFKLVNGTHLQIGFDEQLERSSLQPTCFQLLQHQKMPVNVDLNSDSTVVDLYFDPGFMDVIEGELQVTGITDISGNEIIDTSLVFSYERIRIDSIELMNDSLVRIAFNKDLPPSAWDDAHITLMPENYLINEIIQSDGTEFHLCFEKPLPEAVNHTIRISNVRDERGDTICSKEENLWYYHARRFDVVINELMVDPEPSIGLPETEFIELHNRSAYKISLSGWQICVNDKVCELPDCIVQPKSIIVLVSSSKKELWTEGGNVVFVDRWPTLTNEKLTAVLRSSRNVIIDAWYFSRDRIEGEPFKKEGGWSAERLDVNNLSGEDGNWHWSMNLNGGTPGINNSVATKNPDQTHPTISYITVPNDSTLEIYFSEVMDLNECNEQLSFTQGAGEFSILQIDSVFLKHIEVRFDSPLQSGELYQFLQCEVKDWAGHSVDWPGSLHFGPWEVLEVNDVIINEILFNPRPGEVDFIELYNRSNKVIDVAQIAFAKLDAAGLICQLYPFTDKHRILLPDGFLVLTPDSSLLKSSYECQSQQHLLTVTDFPALADDKGQVVLVSKAGVVIDSMSYTADMHFDLLKDKEGVSLERLSPDMASSSFENWHSAASTVGYATPTYINSQAMVQPVIDDVLMIEPEVFTPNGDGEDDQLMIHINNKEAGGTISIRIYDAMGQEVSYLVNNQTMASQELFTWDGLGDNRQRLVPGVYIVWCQCFYPSGQVQKLKKTCVLSYY